MKSDQPAPNKPAFNSNDNGRECVQSPTNDFLLFDESSLLHALDRGNSMQSKPAITTTTYLPPRSSIIKKREGLGDDDEDSDDIGADDSFEDAIISKALSGNMKKE
jgi:hypothetical protein